MPKYNYRLTDKAIEGTRLEVLSNPNAVILTILADTPESAHEIGMDKINMNDWELDHVEE